MVIVRVHYENISPIEVVPLMAVALMCVQIDDHDPLEGKASLHVVCGQCDVGIYAKPTPT